MEIYLVTISSRGENWTDERSVRGYVSALNGAVRIKYNLDGDDCTLTVKDKTVVQERCGGQNIKMTFKEGESTSCTLSSGGFSGSFEIFTRRLEFTTETNGYKLRLEYSGVSENETVILNFTAEKEDESLKK